MDSNIKIDNKIVILILIGVIILCVGLGVLFSKTNTFNNNGEYQGTVITNNGIMKINSNDFSILPEETKGTRLNNNTYTIKGKIKQNVEGSFTGLMLVFNLLDKNNKKASETNGLIYTNYLGNNIWEFEVSGNDADNIITNYEISYCYGY